jgi:hypothetical protein
MSQDALKSQWCQTTIRQASPDLLAEYFVTVLATESICMTLLDANGSGAVLAATSKQKAPDAKQERERLTPPTTQAST